MALLPIGQDTLPTLWLHICRLWMIVSVGSLAMVISVWLMIIIQNLDTFQNTMGTYMGNDVLRYPPGDPNNGFVNNTNIPKHLGGAVFAAALDVAMIILSLLALAGDTFFRFPFGKQVLQMMFMSGTWSDKKLTEMEFFFLVANAFLKIFICVVTGSQTFVGIRPHNTDSDTPLYCLYATMILLCTVPLTLIANAFIIHRARHETYAEELKALEAAKPAAPSGGSSGRPSRSRPK